MGTEGIQDKYINPYADFGFKLLFVALDFVLSDFA